MDPSEFDPVCDQKSASPKSNNFMQISPARLEANRRNAQKSTGPRTPEGKAISRQNALKHGLTGKGVVLHPEDRERLKTRLADWTRDLDPQDSIEAWLVQRAALASVRLDRCAAQEDAWLDDRIATATQDWLEHQHSTTEDHAERLAATPIETLQVLQSRGIGCQWLMEAWAQLGRSLQAHGHLERPEIVRLLNLMGESKLPQPDARATLTTVWLAALAVLPDHELDDQALPAPEAARATLAEFFKSEHDRLEQRSQALWGEVEGPELNKARSSVVFDTSDDAQRMARYEKANTAELHKCLNLLSKKRREAGRSPRSENNATSSANRVAQAVSGSDGNGQEPFVMPKGLSERVAASPELVSQPVEARYENGPAPTGTDVLTPDSSACSAEPVALAAASAGGMPAQT